MDTFVDQKQATSENLPFRLAGGQNPLILVRVYVNDTGPYEFILDTGASHSLLSPELAETLRVQPEMEKQAMGAGGPVKLGFARVASMAVASARQSSVQVAITDELKRVGVAIGNRVDGCLGFEFLKDFCVTIDYQASELRLAPGTKGSSRGPSATSIPFALAAAHKPIILVQAMVNDQGPFQFALDTGASRTMMSLELARKLAIETMEDAPVTGGGGQVKIFAGKVNSLTVGTAVVRGHAVGAGDFLRMLSEAIGAKLDGIIGYNFLNQFRVTINYPQRILELVPA